MLSLIINSENLVRLIHLALLGIVLTYLLVFEQKNRPPN